MRSRTKPARLIPMLGIAALLAIGCAGTGRTMPPHDPQASAVSSEIEPQRTEFSSKPDLIPQRPPVASRGGCEPRYKKAGLTGTCINNKPCRGFGVLENDRAVCVCFAKRGGCDEGFRCDPRASQCVKEDEEPFNRAP